MLRVRLQRNTLSGCFSLSTEISKETVILAEVVAKTQPPAFGREGVRPLGAGDPVAVRDLYPDRARQIAPFVAVAVGSPIAWCLLRHPTRPVLRQRPTRPLWLWRHFCVNIGAALAGSHGRCLASTAGLPTLFWSTPAPAHCPGAPRCFCSRPEEPDRAWSTAGPSYSNALPGSRLWLLSLASLCALTCAGSVFTALAEAHELRWSRRDRIRMDAGGQYGRRAPPFPLTIDEWPRNLLVELHWPQPRTHQALHDRGRPRRRRTQERVGE